MARPNRPSVEGVFINCPFDQQYSATFNGLIFVIHACGFRPRSARELDDGGQARIEKLYGIIEDCRYGIHDLSRTELDAQSGLPRFNMPLELGIFLGAKRYGGGYHRAKRLLVLDVEQYRYQQFMSDLAGMDIHAHGGEPRRAITEARDWLTNVSRRKLPSGATLLRLYDRFIEELPPLCDALGFDPEAVPYVDYEQMVVGWLLEGERD